MGLLKHLHGICERNKLKYWLDGGTLLGAVRHKGFIPWDDDLDVAMPMADYIKFIKIAQSELPDSVFLQTKQTDPGYSQTFAKLRDRNSLYIEHVDNFAVPYCKGIYIDIFPFVAYPDAPAIIIKNIVKTILTTQYFINKYHKLTFKLIAKYAVEKIRYSFAKVAWQLLSLRKGTSCANIPEDNGYLIQHEEADVFPLITIEFEGYAFNAPSNPDAYLKTLFKNYMQLPPEEKRKSHACYIVPSLMQNGE